MKKKLCSLLIALIVLASFHMTSVSAEGTFGELYSESFSDGFENMEPGKYYSDVEIQDATGIPMQFINISNTGTMVNATIIEEQDGNKYVRFEAVRLADEIHSLYSLNKPLSVGKLEAGFEFSPAPVGTGKWHFFEVFNASGSSEPAVGWGNVIEKSTSTQTGTVHTRSPLRNSKGRYSLHCEVSRMSVNDDWEIKVYDASQANYVLLYSGTFASSFGDITQIKPIRYWAEDGGWPADFDNYYVKATAYPEVIEASECIGLGSDVESFALGYNAPLPDPEDEVMLVNATNENAEPITTKTNYDAETGRIEIMPNSILNYATTYKVVFASGGVSTYSFTTAQAPIRIGTTNLTYSNGTNALPEIPATGTFNATYTVTARTYTPGKQIVVVLAAYNEEGTAVAFDLATQPLTPGANRTTTATLTGLQGGNVTEIKTYLLDYVEGIGYRPMK